MDFTTNNDFMTNDLAVPDLMVDNLKVIRRRAIAATPCVNRLSRTRAGREARSLRPTIPRC